MLGIPLQMALLAAILSGPAQSPCALPADFTNIAVHRTGSFSFTFGVDKDVYASDEPIKFCLVVENIGWQQVTIGADKSPQYAFVVCPDSFDTLDRFGCLESATLIFPQRFMPVPTLFALEIGSCETFVHTWDQLQETRVTPGPGAYRAFGGLVESGRWPLTFKLGSGQSVRLLVKAEGKPVQAVSWGYVKSRYH